MHSRKDRCFYCQGCVTHRLIPNDAECQDLRSQGVDPHAKPLLVCKQCAKNKFYRDTPQDDPVLWCITCNDEIDMEVGDGDDDDVFRCQCNADTSSSSEDEKKDQEPTSSEHDRNKRKREEEVEEVEEKK